MPESPPKLSVTEATESLPNDSGKRRKVVKVDPAAARILKRLDQLEQRLQDHSTAGAGQPDASSSGRWDELQQSILDQNNAIACIASAVSGLQDSLTDRIADAVAESLRQHQPPEKITKPDTAAAEPVVNGEAAGGPAKSQAKSKQPVVAAPAGAADRWAQIRAAFLAESDANDSASNDSEEQMSSEPDADAEAATGSDENGPSGANAQNDAAADRDAEQTLAILNAIPTLVDAAKVPESELRSVLIDRDRFISMLTGRLQSTLRRSQPLTNQQLKDISEMAPEELQRKIDQTLNALDSQVRLGELELSLERARIARQASTLEATKEKLAAAARALGMTLNDNGTLEGEADAGAKGSRGRNWLGAMGFGN